MSGIKAKTTPDGCPLIGSLLLRVIRVPRMRGWSYSSIADVYDNERRASSY